MHGGNSGIYFLKLVFRERHLNSPDIFLKTIQFRGTGNGHDPWFLSQKPGQGDLGRSSLFLVSNVREKVNNHQIGILLVNVVQKGLMDKEAV